MVNAKNANLGDAQRNKNDEFYTQRTDIEKEMRHYKGHFKGKTVYCNCDDPRASEFTKFFMEKFEEYGLKKLVATCYRSTDPDLFSSHDEDKGASIRVVDAQSLDRGGDVDVLRGNGDFSSPECVALLKKADIVVTNPPFSLFREYIAQLMEHGKQFIVMGNMNAATMKEIFPLIRANRIWYGPSISSGDREFRVPDHYPLNAAGYRVDEDGNRFIRVKGVRWFTNMDHKRRHAELRLWRRYGRNPEIFPKYDNYDAINVDKSAHIPEDYDGPMGVPITFLDKYCPSQFEILGITDRDNNSGLKTKEYQRSETPDYGNLNRRGAILVNGDLKSTYARIFIRRRA